MRSIVCAFLAIVLSSSATAADKMLLVPLARAAAGAAGTVWVPALWVRNDSAEVVRLTACSPCTVLDRTFTGDPETTFSPSLFLADFGSSALLLHVPEAVAHEVHASLRLIETTRGESWGVEIPVVAESGFIRGKSVLFPAPVSPDFRVHLRLYAIDRDTRVSVKIFQLTPFGKDVHVSTRDVEVLVPPDARIPRIYAGMALVTDLVEGLHLPPDPISGPARVRIELENDGSSRYWAMLSVTSNATHQVTIVSPK